MTNPFTRAARRIARLFNKSGDDTPTPDRTRHNLKPPSDAAVDESVDDTFPASDPPALQLEDRDPKRRED